MTEPTIGELVTSPAVADTLYGGTVADQGASLAKAAAEENVVLLPQEQATETRVVRDILERYSDGNATTARDLGGALAIGLRKPVSAEQAENWRAESESWLKAEFGPRSGEILKKAAAIVRADAALAQRLRGGLGNHISVVKALAAHAAKAAKK